MPETNHPPFLGAWLDDETERAEPREPLTRSRIVAAAVALLDRHGAAALSMRTLADELHTRATSLYRHVHNKGELLDLTLDALMAEVELPAAELDWRESLRAIAVSFRAVLRRHPGAAVLRGTRLAIGPNTLRLMEAAGSRLLDAGFSEEEAAASAATVINYTVGAVLAEVMPTLEIEAAGYSWEQFSAQMDERLAALPLDRFPATRKMLPMLIGHHHDQPFEFGLDALLEGLAARRGQRVELR
jgi:AcrR family transcriptional regulator